MSTKNALGEIIRQLRGDLSLREFAVKCDVSHTTIDNLEKGIDFRTGKPTQVKMSTLQKIADACDVPVSYILNEAKKQSTDSTASLSDLKLAILEVIDQIPEEAQRNFLEMAKLYASSHKKD